MKSKLWKTLGALGLSAALVAALAGCASKQAEPTPTPTQAEETATPQPTETLDADDILTEDDIPDEDDGLEEEPVEESTGYVPGTYTGEGTGNNGIITVEVTVDEEKILAVNVVEHQETAGVCDEALEQIPGAILAAQSADVDTVAGATMTSQGIIDAVNAALELAAQ